MNWYLTEDDGSNDGKITSYLEKATPMLKEIAGVFSFARDNSLLIEVSFLAIMSLCFLETSTIITANSSPPIRQM